MDPARRTLDECSRSTAPTDAYFEALTRNLGLRSGEQVLVVTDAAKRSIGELFHEAARRVTPRVKLEEIPIAARNGDEPPAGTAAMMAAADVVVLPLSRSISWTRAREAATRAGARVASMPGITTEIIRRTFAADYAAIRVRANRLADLLDRGSEVHVTSAAGTDLTLSIAGRSAHGRKGGIYREPGHWGNLPCGEAFIAPLEGTASGIYVVDASHGGLGRVSTPIRVEVDAGRAVTISGGAEADRLFAMLEAVGDPRAFNVAELGIGCNHAARISGITLEDEKAIGTCHIALGSNAFFGGAVDVGVHLDGVLRRPAITIDGVAAAGS
jgi:leucyl aminopeptidase (aminopeptidase T)